MKKLLRWLHWNGVGLVLLGLWPADLKATTWDTPRDTTHHSENGQFQFFVAIGSAGIGSAGSKNGARGTLSRKSGDNWEGVWTNRLVNGIRPVSVLIADSGRYVVTFDEYYSVGMNPVVIYGDRGRLIANLSLADLKLENHSNITLLGSGFWWNRKAIIVFGPPAKPGGESWARTLEDSLFIRLYWGEVIAIDLASGRVRDEAWWDERAANDAKAMQQATKDYLDATWLRLAHEYLRKENFEPDPKDKGVKGILLAGQLRLGEALPLLREVAATDRFQHWSAPTLKGGDDSNVRDLAKAAIREIE